MGGANVCLGRVLGKVGKPPRCLMGVPCLLRGGAMIRVRRGKAGRSGRSPEGPGSIARPGGRIVSKVRASGAPPHYPMRHDQVSAATRSYSRNAVPQGKAGNIGQRWAGG
jgi:hypothetical protein